MSFQFDMLHLDAGGTLHEGAIVAGCSWGNDSVALVQWLREKGIEHVTCLYNDTGWSMPAHDGGEAWLERVTRMEAWASEIGFRFARTASMGMEELVRWKVGWPRQGMQFCTDFLKIGPTIQWLAENDPAGMAVCANGKRRAESAERATTPEWIDPSPFHGGRRLWQPLYATDDGERDALIRRAGFEPLPHKSKECKVCVNENAAGLAGSPEIAIADIERIELDLGLSAKGKPRTMFRPAKKMGATGIREVIRWSKAGYGKYRPLDDGTGLSGTATGCDGGFCAS